MNREEFINGIHVIADMMLWIECMRNQGVQILDDNPIFKLIGSYIEALKKLMKDEAGYIEWFCFDLDFCGKDSGIIWDGDRGYTIDNVEELYDYLIMEGNKND